MRQTGLLQRPVPGFSTQRRVGSTPSGGEDNLGLRGCDRHIQSIRGCAVCCCSRISRNAASRGTALCLVGRPVYLPCYGGISPVVRPIRWGCYIYGRQRAPPSRLHTTLAHLELPEGVLSAPLTPLRPLPRSPCLSEVSNAPPSSLVRVYESCSAYSPGYSGVVT